MKFIIDGSALVADHFSGIGHYIQGLVEEIDQLLGTDEYRDMDVYIAVPTKRADRLDKYHFKHIKTKRIPLPLSVMRRLVVKDWLPAMDRYLGKGVYFFPDYNTWKLAGSLAITTIHDLSFIDVPQYVDTVNGKFMTISLRRSVERASKIATVTNSMKQDIMRHNNLRDRDVIVTENAADLKEFYRRSPEEIKRVKRKYGIPGEYIFSMGNIEPRKNQMALIEALRQAPKKIRDKYTLVLAGAGAWKQEEIEKAVKQAKQDGLKIIVLLGRVSDEDRPALYSGAAMSAYVSFYEGFGMPIIESMAVQTPTIVSNASVMPEVAGKAGVLVNPEDPKSIAKAYRTIDAWTPEKRAEEVAKGIEQARSYSWHNSAVTLLKAVREVAE